jgi:hypothetical protein
MCSITTRVRKNPQKYLRKSFGVAGLSHSTDYEQPVSHPNEEAITDLFRVHPTEALCLLFFRGEG